MTPKSRHAFTLVEMLTVMAVIAILASLVLAVNGFVQRKAAVNRAEGEIAALSAAIENYKADNGSVPRDEETTDKLSPRKDGNPISSDSGKKYKEACQTLYIALTGDKDRKGKPPADAKQYFEFKPDMLKKKPEGEIDFIQDPWGNCYGYSTAALATEETYVAALRADPKAERPSGDASGGYNPTFDLWSTGGTTTPSTGSSGGSGGGSPTSVNQPKWVKNW